MTAMKNVSRYFVMGMLMIIGSAFFAAYSVAKDTGADNSLLESPESPMQYLVQLSGTVMNETFSGTQALLTLMPPPPYSKNSNPYQIVIESFPKKNSRNSFFWRSEDSEMTAIANEITCDIQRTFVKQVPMYFIFLSPALLRPMSGDPDIGGIQFGSREENAMKVALPTHITATAGQLKLRIYSNTVSGTVWMKGYDPVEKAFVLYSARLYGKRSYHLNAKQQKNLTVGQ
jgi:hypothetical protein